MTPFSFSSCMSALCLRKRLLRAHEGAFSPIILLSTHFSRLRVIWMLMKKMWKKKYVYMFKLNESLLYIAKLIDQLLMWWLELRIPKRTTILLTYLIIYFNKYIISMIFVLKRPGFQCIYGCEVGDGIWRMKGIHRICRWYGWCAGIQGSEEGQSCHGFV